MLWNLQVLSSLTKTFSILATIIFGSPNLFPIVSITEYIHLFSNNAVNNQMVVTFLFSLVIRQKGESQNGCFKKTKHVKFSKKRTFLTPWYAHVCVRIRGLEMFIFWCAYQGVRNVHFLENLACFVFLKNPFWDSLFCFSTDGLKIHWSFWQF